MKGFVRENQLLSLCGLNCGLCPMKLGGYCGGCGNGNQSCKIVRCSLEHGGIEYCFECGEFPCEKYQDAGKYDSFITHRNQLADLEKACKSGIELYNAVQREKVRILEELLNGYNTGRSKNFFCVAVNLMELEQLQQAMGLIREQTGADTLSLKEKNRFAVDVLQQFADQNNLLIKLNRKR